MNKELLERADQLWERADKANKFNDQFGAYPFREGSRLVNDFQRLSEDVVAVEAPQAQEEVYSNELKRRLSSEATLLEHGLSGHYYTFEDVINLFGIDAVDVEGLRGWLADHRDEALDTIDRVYQDTEVGDFRIPVRVDIPSIKTKSEGITAGEIENYHQKLSRFFGEKIKVGRLLADIQVAPTSDGRSSFHPQSKLLSIGIPAICYMTPDRSLYINEKELIRLYGHEGMGHGLSTTVTEASDLPGFLKRFSITTRATLESVGQHFEEVIFDDLKDSPKTQKELRIAHNFGEIYQNHKDAQLIDLYQRLLQGYAISVLANKEFGDMSDPVIRREAIEKRISVISEVALYPGYAVGIVEGQQHNYDSQGNLSPTLAQEMVYVAKPVQRVLDLMQDRGVLYEGAERDRIDILLLSGYWTPIGLVENAQVSKV